MKTFYTALLLILISSVQTSIRTPRTGWNAIVPLHTQRSEVTGLLGAGTGDCKCIYHTSTAVIRIDYADARCKGPINGWNVPTDTVLQVAVTPAVPRKFSDLGIDETVLRKWTDQETPTTYFADDRAGVRYSVQDGYVIREVYLPSPQDNFFRCKGFPSYDPLVAELHPFDSFPVASQEQIRAHLDELAVQLRTRPNFKAYIISYGKKTARRNQAKRTAQLCIDYLIRQRGLPRSKVFAIDGGFRDAAELELYLIPNEQRPPLPKPSLPRGNYLWLK